MARLRRAPPPPAPHAPPSDAVRGIVTEAGEPDQDSGTATKDSGSISPGVNPCGVPYPTDNIGMSPRAGSKRGNRVSNLTFQGYRPGSSSLVTVAPADLYDPQSKTHDVVYVFAGTLWSAPDQKGLDAIKGSTKRIATLAVIGEGHRERRSRRRGTRQGPQRSRARP